MSFYLVSFAAGALLATGIVDTLPEAAEKNQDAFFLTTIFIVLFYSVEKILFRFHHHEEEKSAEGRSGSLRTPVFLLLSGDALHNFIDGVAIASTFMVSFPLGLITSLAVFIHEIPHELADFGLLLHKGYTRGKVLGFNILTGIAALLGAILGYFVGKEVMGMLPILLALTSANFIYLSLTDLLPEIQHQTKDRTEFAHLASFIIGAAFIMILVRLLRA